VQQAINLHETVVALVFTKFELAGTPARLDLHAVVGCADASATRESTFRSFELSSLMPSAVPTA
jgi:hypothetical protein